MWFLVTLFTMIQTMADAGMVRMPRCSMAEDTFPGSFDSAPQLFPAEGTFRRCAQDDKREKYSLKLAVMSQMQTDLHLPNYQLTHLPNPSAPIYPFLFIYPF